MPTVDSGQIVPGTGEIVYSSTNVATASASGGSVTSTPVQYLTSVVGSNVGTGDGLYVGATGSTNITLQFKTLVEGNNILITTTNDTVEITSLSAFIGLTDTPTAIITNGILFGSSTNSLNFIPAPTSVDQILSWNGTAFVWTLAGSGTVQQVTINPSTGISVTGSPITTTGTYSIGLTASGATPGTYFAPTMTVDQYGRVTHIQSELELPLVGISTLAGTYSGAIPIYSGLASQVANFVSIDALAPLNIALSSDNSTVIISLTETGITTGTYTNIVVDNFGRITSIRTLSNADVITALGYSPLAGTSSVLSTPNTIALRDSNGNITTGTFIGNLTGNAATATALQNSITFSIAGGDVNGSATFNGSTNVSFPVYLNNNGVTAGTYNNIVVDTTGRVISGTNISANSVTLIGDVSGSGTGTITTTLVANGVTPGTYDKVIVDTTGRVISGTTLSAADVSVALGYSPVSSTILGSALGVATLDATGKLVSSQIPSSLVGALNYQGTWNATTNTPSLVSSVGNKGYYYKVAVAGTTTINGISQWNIGDMIVYDGTTWDKIDGIPNEVISVAGMTGIVTLSVSNITGAAPLASPAFTGTPNAPTPTLGDSSSLIATTSFVQEQIISSATINATGDITGSGLGTIAFTLVSTGVTPGTYNSVVVDGKGRITNASTIASTQSFALSGAVVGSGIGTVNTTLTPTGVSAGTYTSVVVDIDGRISQAQQIQSSDIVTALGFTPLGAGNEGVANGLATLDSSGKLVSSQIPDSLLGAVMYQGTWNASTNTPTLASGVGTVGYYYKVSVAGTTNIDGNFQWNIGDMIIFDGTTWDKIDGISSEVISVAGMTGAVTLSVSNITGAAPLASPAFTGAPTAPTPALSDSSTSIATTFFVKQQNYLTTNQTITVSGDASGTGTTSIALALASVMSAGTYNTVVVDTKGRVIAGSTGTSGYTQQTFSFQINFDANGNISSIGTMPANWTSTLDNINQVTVTHGLGVFPQSVICFGYNNNRFTMKTPNGNPSGQFSIGINSSTTTPNTFTIYGLNSTAVNAAVSSYTIVQVLI